MIGKKNGKSCFKKFILIANKTEFDNLNSTRSLFLEQKKEKAQQEIIVPRYETVQPVCPPKNKTIPQHYVKTIQNKLFLDKFHYQLDSIDLSFYQNNFSFLPEQIFVKIFVRLQKKAYQKGDCQINYKRTIQKIFNEINLKLSPQKIQELMKTIYNFWKNKRKNIRSPLLRQFWVQTFVGPFKNRQNCPEGPVCLRNRAVKVQDWYIKEVLKQDLLILKQIFILMRDRQKAQRILIKSQTQSFQKSCKKVLKKISEQQQQENQYGETSSIKNKKSNSLRKSKRKQVKPRQKSKFKSSQVVKIQYSSVKIQNL